MEHSSAYWFNLTWVDFTLFLGDAYETRAVPTSTSMSIGLPSSSVAGWTSKTCRIDAIVKKSDALARWRPGHILYPNDLMTTRGGWVHMAYLRPNPKIIVEGSLTFGSIFPSLINLSGLNRSGCGYSSGSCNIALNQTLFNEVFAMNQVTRTRRSRKSLE